MLNVLKHVGKVQKSCDVLKGVKGVERPKNIA